MAKFSKCCLIPQRFILVLMGCLAIINAYALRVSLSMSIIEMVPRVNQTDIPGSCAGDNSTHIKKGQHSDKIYQWSEKEQGFILSSFFYGYFISHLPGGVLAEMYGAKHVLGIGLLISAVITLATPVIISATDGNVYILIASRVIIGLGQGTTYPALNVILAHWIPKKERALCGSIVFAGAQIGTIVSNFGVGAMISSAGNWEITFYAFGAFGVAWWVAWMILCYSRPDNSPFISDKELAFLHEELDAHITKEKMKIPWKALLTSAPTWALICANWGHDWGWFVMVTDLPKYMSGVLKFEIKENGIWSSLPYILMWIIAVATGYLCDWLIFKQYLGITNARKIFSFISNVGPGAFMLLAVYSGCNKLAAVAMFTIGMGLMGTYYCGMKVNALDLSPNFSGTVMAFVNGLGCLAGMIAPAFIGLIVQHHSFGEWQIVFWVTFAILTITSVVYVFFASGEVQSWNSPSEAQNTEG